METRAQYALVGFFVVALVVAGTTFAIYLGQVRFQREFAEYEVVFQGPVRGLSNAGEVRFNGIRVGEVTELGLDPDDPTQVIADIRVDASTPFRADSVAQLEPQGITGASFIQISAGTPSRPLLERGARIDSIAPQLEQLIEGGGDIVESASEALARINALLSDENVAAVSATLENVAALSASLNGDVGEGGDAGLRQRATATLTSLEAAADQINAAATDLSAFAQSATRLVDGQLSATLVDAQSASQNVDQAAQDTQGLIADFGPVVDSFAEEGLPETTMAVRDLRRLIARLDAIAADLEDDPAAFIAGPGAPEREVPR